MSLFHFKQFVIDQENCPMKINTDGVLLGASVGLKNVRKVLDIGTGTGVIALMLAQRSHEIFVDAIDIDHFAFEKASLNFNNSLFHEQLKAHHHGFIAFFELNPQKKYDLIVSNPPYFLNALKSPKLANNISKHTNEQFFIDLISKTKNHLNPYGNLTLIVPVDISLMLQNLAPSFGLKPVKCVKIKSYPDKAHIRHIISFSNTNNRELKFEDFCIYASPGVYSLQYQALLKNFFKIF
ncbi:methyltransferase [Pedobacter sp. SD-b]|uniref:tRNA1(Val) (adenine(37)-N6)-methyltransferase n=1 Tax=Pedobacter segetis TaxID=2793069 RepID=A0ABS1BJP5_9SPHI|nr:methyltransferase [Pedobacter segetis]MBK0382986.1 methyltransferase [Pedobacter segetis]